MQKNKKSGHDLADLRNLINEIDGRLIKSINERLLLAKEIGAIKAQNGSHVLDLARENEIIKRLTALNKGPLPANALETIIKEIFAASREIQNPQKITFLGPEATYTHIAAMKFFGRCTSFYPQPTIREIFNEVEKGTYDYGVVPVENSIEGSVNYTLDLFSDTDLKICGEKYQNISHDLLSKSGSMKDIRAVYSHPQAFAQCRMWLQKNLPDAELLDCSSTAYAAEKVSAMPEAAAIASNEAAQIYKLKLVASKIEDSSRNTTRFLIIGKNNTRSTGNDKTSLMFVASHVPGSLYKVLSPIAEKGINMVKLESRPAKNENWQYIFFVDIKGHMEDPGIKETVDKVRGLCMYLKWLGSYPMEEL